MMYSGSLNTSGYNYIEIVEGYIVMMNSSHVVLYNVFSKRYTPFSIINGIQAKSFTNNSLININHVFWKTIQN